ncbi:hypothetical protein PG997_010973 [Apiospora hydei]|uniref:NB-ARC domain-containing protein n=1 Tax=Apiospora hydei TaxID=1337664 RepID=A0ABR1VHU4_9PEZI
MSVSHLVEQYPAPDQSQKGIDIILVDGLLGGEPGLSNWAEPLHSRLLSQSMNSAIQYLDLGIKLEKLEDFPRKMKEAEEILLRELYQFIKVLCIAHDIAEQEHRAKLLMTNVSQVVLLGTPPATGDAVKVMKTINIIICQRSLAKDRLGELADVQRTIDDIGISYKERGLPSRSVVCVETQKTKYGHRDLKHVGRHKQRVLVDAAMWVSRFPDLAIVETSGKLSSAFETNMVGEIIELLRQASPQGLSQLSDGPSTRSRSNWAKSRWKRAAHWAGRHDSGLVSEELVVEVPRYYNLPPPQRNLVRGRETELESIHQYLQRKVDPMDTLIPLRAVMVYGKPGMGITALATEYHTIATSLLYILEIVDRNSNNSEANWSILEAWLQNPLSVKSTNREKRFDAKWLLIMEDVTVDTNILDFWPRQGDGSILVLGKHPAPLRDETIDITPVELPSLPENDAASLFLSVAEVTHPVDQTVLDIVNDWECIPAAVIRVAMKYRNRKQRESLPEFKAYQTSNRKDLLLRGVSHMSSIAALWTLDGRSSSEWSILSVLPFLHHAQIPEVLFSNYLEPTETSELPGGYLTSRRRLEVDRLIDVMEPGHGVNETTISTDKVLQDSIRVEYLESGDDLAIAFNRASSMVNRMWPKSITAEISFSELDERGRWKTCQKLLTHVKRIAGSYVDLDPDVQRDCAQEDFIKLMIEAAWYLNQKGRYNDATKLLDVASLALRRAPREMLDLLSALYNTGTAIASTANDTATALERCQQFKEVQKRIFRSSGVETVKLAAAYSELGMAYLQTGQASAAVWRLLQKSRQIREGLPNFEKVNLFSVLRGEAFYHLLHREYDEAETKLLEACEDRRLKYGTDDRRGGRAGALLFELGIVIYQQSLQVSDKKELERLLKSSTDYLERAKAIFSHVDIQYIAEVADADVAIARNVLASNADKVQLHKAQQVSPSIRN